MTNTPASPCIRNCCLNEQDVCLGCYRSIDEIVGWGSASPSEKQAILNQAKQREIIAKQKIKQSERSPEPFIQLIAYQDPRLAYLVKCSDDYTLSLYPPEICFLDSVADLAEQQALVFGSVLADDLQGIAAAKMITDRVVELKRVFVLEQYRGRQIAQKLLHAIEQYFIPRGLQQLILETGIHQPEAIALYRKLGFSNCGPFAHYEQFSSENLAQSVFMQKSFTVLK